MKQLNERLHETIVLKNVSEHGFGITTQDKPQGILVDPSKTIRVLIGDLVSVLRGNKFLYGTDEEGTNAALYIDNDEVRELLGFDKYEVIKKSKAAIKKETDNAKEGEVISDTTKKLVKEQVILSKKVFINSIIGLKGKDLENYIRTLGEVTDGQKIMIAKILNEERGRVLGNVSNATMILLEEMIR